MKKVLFLNDTSNELHIGSKSISNLIKHNLVGVETVSVQFRDGRYIVPTNLDFDMVVVNAEGTLARDSARAKALLDIIMLCAKIKLKVLLSGDISEYSAAMLKDFSFDFVHYRRLHSNSEKLNCLREILLPDLFYYVCFSAYGEAAQVGEGMVLGDSHNIYDFQQLSKMTLYPTFNFKNQSMMVFDNYEVLNVDFLKSKFWFVSRSKVAAWRKRYSTVGFIKWLGIISASRIMLTGRFHHAIASLAVGTPVLYVETETKKMYCLQEFFEGKIEKYESNDQTIDVFEPLCFDYSPILQVLRGLGE